MFGIETACFLVMLAFLVQGSEGDIPGAVSSRQPERPRITSEMSQAGSAESAKQDTKVPRLVRRSVKPKLVKATGHDVRIQGTAHPTSRGSLAQGTDQKVQRLVRRSTSQKLAKVPWQEATIQGTAHAKQVQIHRSVQVSIAQDNQDNDTKVQGLMRSTKKRKSISTTKTPSRPMQIFNDGHMSVLSEERPSADFENSSGGIGKQTFVVDQSGETARELESSRTLAQGDLVSLGTMNLSKDSSGASLAQPVSRADSASKVSVSNSSFVQVMIIVLLMIVILLLLQLYAQNRRRYAREADGLPPDSQLLRPGAAPQIPKWTPKEQTSTQQIPRHIIEERRTSYRSRRKLSQSNTQNALGSPSMSEDAGSPNSQRAGSKSKPSGDEASPTKSISAPRLGGRSPGTVAGNRFGFVDGRIGTATMGSNGEGQSSAYSTPYRYSPNDSTPNLSRCLSPETTSRAQNSNYAAARSGARRTHSEDTSQRNFVKNRSLSRSKYGESRRGSESGSGLDSESEVAPPALVSSAPYREVLAPKASYEV